MARLAPGIPQEVVDAVVATEDEGVAEVVHLVAIVGTLEIEGVVLGPLLEVGTSSHHNHLAAVAGIELILMCGEEGVVELVCLVVYGRACAESGVLLVDAAAWYKLAEGGVGCGIGCADSPDGVIGTYWVRTIIL